jgi:3-hydroxyisobutyrate dehydrogenase-like beta-hydroxyacid dehydrogenase
MATTNHSPQLNIGFIGLGDQGAPMARAIAEAGWPLHVWARHPGSLVVLANAPDTTHDSVPGLGHACDIVGLCLTDDSDLREILEDLGLLPSLPLSGIIVNHGTGDPQTAARLAQHVREHGHELLDAPVSGGRPAAESSFALQFLAGEISPEMRQHLPELWHKDIGHFSDAIRTRELPPSILEARAHESVEAFHTALAAIGSTTHPQST